MARRKVELLDLLRQGQARKETPPAPQARPTQPEPSIPRPERQKPAKRAEARQPFRLSLPDLSGRNLTIPVASLAGILVLVAVLALSGGSGEEPLQAADRNLAQPDLLSTGTPAAVVPAKPSPPAYGILAITYNYSPADVGRAKDTAKLLKQKGFPQVRVYQKPFDRPEHIEIFVGAAVRSEDLQPILEKLRRTDTGNARYPKPFRGAQIRSYPDVITP